jgi:hypothetical protein
MDDLIGMVIFGLIVIVMKAIKTGFEIYYNRSFDPIVESGELLSSKEKIESFFDGSIFASKVNENLPLRIQTQTSSSLTRSNKPKTSSNVANTSSSSTLKSIEKVLKTSTTRSVFQEESSLLPASTRLSLSPDDLIKSIIVNELLSKPKGW